MIFSISTLSVYFNYKVTRDEKNIWKFIFFNQPLLEPTRSFNPSRKDPRRRIKEKTKSVESRDLRPLPPREFDRELIRDYRD